MKTILVVDAHPDPAPERYGHALAAAYRDGANAAGHASAILEIASLDVAPLRSAGDWRATPPGWIAEAQARMAGADHLVFIHPLWMGALPAYSKAFLEQVLRPAFTGADATGTDMSKSPLRGKSARVIVTMGMPAPVYTFFFRAHSLKALKRNIFSFVGLSPVRHTLIGGVEAIGDRGRARWLERIADLGRRGA